MGKKNTKKRQTYSSSKAAANKSSNKSLIWLTIIILAVIGIVVIGMVNQSDKGFTFDYDKLPVTGSKDAPVKLVEFGDYKCPTCQYFAQNIKPQLDKDFIETGKASLHFVNYSFLGPDSVTAALAAQAVYHQNNDAFWTYYKTIYDNQQSETIKWATPEYLVQLARDAKLDIDFDKLKQDIDNKTYAKEVAEHNDLVRPAGVTGTPTLFINGKKYTGSLDYGDIKAAINGALKEE